ncbi:MAG: hypothetical protein ACRDTA_07370 [Pseudonocardiaceae bacterium]
MTYSIIHAADMAIPAHLPTTVLDGYLHHTLPSTDHQQIRAHLDCCEPCWQAWNRHRWDAARPSDLYAQLAEFLGADFRPYFDSSRALAAEWDAVNPHTDHDIAQFFRTSTDYLYNLAIWDASGNRPQALLRDHRGVRPPRTDTPCHDGGHADHVLDTGSFGPPLPDEHHRSS